jgi:hypothetical protein
MIKRGFVKAIGAVMILVLFNSCTTMMRVNVIERTGKPVDNATVLVNDENIGQTPNARTKVSNFVGYDTRITVLKDGYYPARKEADKEIKAGPVIVGWFFLWPVLLWAYGPKAQQSVFLTPEETAENR